MTLIIGGAGQGKLSYVLSRTGLSPEDVSQTLPTHKPILYGLQNLTRSNPNLTVQDIPDCIVICDEIGCGVVPISPEERAWREHTGRLCCELAQRAQRVERIFCGLPMVLKGNGPWK
jgi:adenosyl cobinamide kinase/adenosyl cobinamide phosphate guanylyltransferase